MEGGSRPGAMKPWDSRRIVTVADDTVLGVRPDKGPTRCVWKTNTHISYRGNRITCGKEKKVVKQTNKTEVRGTNNSFFNIKKILNFSYTQFNNIREIVFVLNIASLCMDSCHRSTLTI